jgi:hypothetical protein
LELEANRTERIRRAKVTRKYSLSEIIRKYDVEAEIVKRQFIADKAGIREKLVSELTAQWFQIHREKRALDMCVPGNPPFPSNPAPREIVLMCEIMDGRFRNGGVCR